MSDLLKIGNILAIITTKKTPDTTIKEVSLFVDDSVDESEIYAHETVNIVNNYKDNNQKRLPKFWGMNTDGILKHKRLTALYVEKTFIEDLKNIIKG